MNKNLRSKLVEKFVCTMDKCPDTCCKHWSMQVDDITYEKYKNSALELLSAVVADSDGSFIMSKDLQTGYCVKFTDGKCGIQSNKGEEYLGDACALYPRITRNLGDTIIMTATMSCPEIAKIALYDDNIFEFSEAQFLRTPQEIKNILPPENSVEDALAIHNLFIAATKDEAVGAEHIFARIASVSRSLQLLAKKDWANAAPIYFRLADGRIPKAEANINDPFNLLHSLCGLLVASKKSVPTRLQQTISDIEKSIHADLDWQNALIKTHDDSLEKYNNIYSLWKNYSAKKYDVILKRWIAAQLSSSLYPFAGLGETLTDRITIIGVRFAILRLALMSVYSISRVELQQDDVVRIVQSLSRFLEHLSDSAFSLQIYAETGWNKEARMLGLLV